MVVEKCEYSGREHGNVGGLEVDRIEEGSTHHVTA